ncbi:hypothetical protein [Encephalitozoon cuniculi GB-M1]|uniref:Uncharacterized protein ECU10_1070 n=1 Tax=Encephalitozoon cuniculi (strain GB-M1) TaxID=284813 RepID=YAA7_ENCCU|nr:uncharacterized protein ECU10_1070 [Encephalitozoon cuniculi GB-M1]Q8SUD4.1 RecName: Full=Uncharacterized protein ECU10_1070 [Encephalitozoon cuniculi GB-M1]CAD25826.1 hypothetical protein [Encephalitozoon cuniculi GB-M1]
MTQESTMNDIYPLAALLIYATNQKVTKEKISSVFKFLGLESHPKICEFFEVDAVEIKKLLMSSTQEAAAPAGPQEPAEASGDAGKKEEVEEEEIEIDFGMF